MKKIVMLMIAAIMTFCLLLALILRHMMAKQRHLLHRELKKEGIISQLLKILKNVDLQTYR